MKNLYQILQIGLICRGKKSLRQVGLMLPFLCLLLVTAMGQQTGYIYVHSKALNEADSPDITYSVTGGSTTVPDFTLNDNPSQTIIDDIGASQNGRLWAVSHTNELCYRDALTPNWIKTSVTGVARVDGGPNGTCFYIDTAGTVFSYTGSGTATQISATGQFTSSSADIGSGWTPTPYIINGGPDVYQYSGSGTTWNTYTTVASNVFYKIDVNPSNGDVFVATISSTGIIGRRVKQIKPSLAVSDLGNPGSTNNGKYRDLAVNENGEIYVTAYTNSAPFGWYVYKFSSGTTWVRELSSFDGEGLTGGVGNSLWLTMNSGGWNNGSGPYPFYNIFSRGFDGSEATYIDDERVRLSPAAGNSQLIPVAPGTYTITETVPGGWDLQKITVFDPTANSSVDLGTRSAIVTVAADEVVNVVFQTGEVNPFNMTTDCANAYLETFGAGATGSYGQPVDGQTTYHYLTGNAPGEDGYYKIVNRANPDFNTWSDATDIVDHTSADGLGYMYAVNAGYDKGEFFRRHFTGVIAGANYSFSAWIVNLTATAAVNPNVTFTVLDHATQAVLGTYSTGELTADPSTWQKYGFSFTGSSSDIDLVISNNGLGGNGNDLALDDISFSLAPPDPTITVKNGSCPDGLGSIEVTSPMGAYEYSVDGTTWQAAPLFDNIASGSYTVAVRFTGTTNCTNSTTIATVNPSICGNVFHDVEGLTDGNVDGPGIGTAAAPLYVSLYNGVTLIKTVPVNADGTYTFSDVPANATYRVVLGIDATANPVSPFPGSGNGGWASTGEDCCDAMGSDGSVDGEITIVLGSNSVDNADFGIEQQPNSDNHTTPILQPATNDVVTLDGIGTNPPLLSGNDPEDGTYSGASGTTTAPTGVIITSLPANGVLNYDGNPVAVGDTIADPALLTIVLSGTGYTSVSFNYAYTDAAEVGDPTPAIYTISWTIPLPVTLVNFDVTASESQVIINWTTSSETNSSYFDIERSVDARTWNAIGQVSAKENSNALSKYEFTDQTPANGTNYYRLKMVDQDATFAYSRIQSVLFGENGSTAILYPNPTSDVLKIKNLEKVNGVTIVDLNGKIVYQSSSVSPDGINVKAFSAGIYLMKVSHSDGTVSTHKIVVSR